MLIDINVECLICGNKKNNTILLATEMMLKTGDSFTYYHCSMCGCLFLLDIPKSINKYYPSNYYSFSQASCNKNGNKLISFARKTYMKGKLGYGSIINKATSKIKKDSYGWIKRNLMYLDSKILDVGCGNGFLIRDMRNYGFINLSGIDPFIKETIYDGDITIYKSDIHCFSDEKYDLIMYHHSFEHIADPHKELQSVFNKLNKNGILLIRIPVSDSYAYRKYKKYWVQLDAPRHLFLHTTRSMFELANKNNYIIDDIIYDSNKFQFTGSECYLRNLSMGEYLKIFTQKELKKLDEKSKELNDMKDGDSACFYLKKRDVT